MATTTVQLTRELKKVLDAMKLHRRESYNDVLERLVEDLQELNAETKRELERAVKEIEAGEIPTPKQGKDRLGPLRRSRSYWLVRAYDSSRNLTAPCPRGSALPYVNSA